MSNAIEGDEKIYSPSPKWENGKMPEKKETIREFHFHL